MFESCSVCESQCVGVELWKLPCVGCGVGRLRCGGCGLLKLWSGGVADFGSYDGTVPPVKKLPNLGIEFRYLFI